MAGGYSALGWAFAAICVMAIIAPSGGYPGGAPTSVCGSLVPGHGSPQTTPPTYRITTDRQTYAPGKTVKVTILGGPFEGLILQARRRRGEAQTPIVGRWTGVPQDTKTMRCSADDDTITHANVAVKQNAAFYWSPPDTDVGEVYFVATIAARKTTWWLGVESAGSLTFGTAPPGGETSTRTTHTTNTIPDVDSGAAVNHPAVGFVPVVILTVISLRLLLLQF